ncbi:hypothetical protein L9F63_019691, partial [Diploptera punctata]
VLNPWVYPPPQHAWAPPYETFVMRFCQQNPKMISILRTSRLYAILSIRIKELFVVRLNPMRLDLTFRRVVKELMKYNLHRHMQVNTRVINYCPTLCRATIFFIFNVYL